MTPSPWDAAQGAAMGSTVPQRLAAMARSKEAARELAQLGRSVCALQVAGGRAPDYYRAAEVEATAWLLRAPPAAPPGLRWGSFRVLRSETWADFPLWVTGLLVPARGRKAAAKPKGRRPRQVTVSVRAGRAVRAVLVLRPRDGQPRTWWVTRAGTETPRWWLHSDGPRRPWTVVRVAPAVEGSRSYPTRAKALAAIARAAAGLA